MTSVGYSPQVTLTRFGSGPIDFSNKKPAFNLQTELRPVWNRLTNQFPELNGNPQNRLVAQENKVTLYFNIETRPQQFELAQKLSQLEGINVLPISSKKENRFFYQGLELTLCFEPI